MNWDLLRPIGPALILAAMFLVGIPLFAVRVKFKGVPDLPDANRRNSTPIATRLVIQYVYWYMHPVENLMHRMGVSANAITYLSLGLCGLSGFYAATGHFAASAWLYLGAGMLDIVDGALARRAGKTSRSGGLLDSVADRWGELFVLGGLLLYMPHTFGRVAVLLCIAGSMMVSYTRARGEAAGIQLKGGTMQRAERMSLVSLGMLVAAVGVCLKTYDYVFYMSLLLLVVGVMSSFTAVHRLVDGYRELQRLDSAAATLDAPASAVSAAPTPPAGAVTKTSARSGSEPAA